MLECTQLSSEVVYYRSTIRLNFEMRVAQKWRKVVYCFFPTLASRVLWSDGPALMAATVLRTPRSRNRKRRSGHLTSTDSLLSVVWHSMLECTKLSEIAVEKRWRFVSNAYLCLADDAIKLKDRSVTERIASVLQRAAPYHLHSRTLSTVY